MVKVKVGVQFSNPAGGKEREQSEFKSVHLLKQLLSMKRVGVQTNQRVETLQLTRGLCSCWELLSSFCEEVSTLPPSLPL